MVTINAPARPDGPEPITTPAAELNNTELLQALFNLRYNNEGLLHSTTVLLSDDTVLPRLRRWLAEDEHPYLAMVANATRYTKDSQSVPRLIELLQHQDDQVSSAAAHALVILADSRALQACVGQLAHANESNRFMAIAALQAINDSSVVAALQRAAAVEKEPYLQRRMQEAIYVLENSDASA